MIILALVAGLAVGAWLGYLLAKKEEAKLRDAMTASEGKRIEAETQLRETLKNLEEQKALLAQAKKELSDTFKALAADALRDNNQAFLNLAKPTIDPLNETLNRYQAHVTDMDRECAGLRNRIGMLLDSQKELKEGTDNLVNALRVPHVRGRWGEITLKRTAELAGMVDQCDFIEQASVEGETGRLQPDMIVNLPSGRQVVVDAKAVLSAYLDAMEATDDAVKEDFFRKHAAQVRARLDYLSGKVYWKNLPEATEFVVLFLPGEQFLGAALEHDRTLIEDGHQKGVFIATPTTLIALFRIIERGWREKKLAETAKEISQQGQDLFERMAILVEHLREMAKALVKMNTAYNDAIGSLESKVLPAARRFKELGIVSDKEIPQLEVIEQTPRPIASADDISSPTTRKEGGR